MRVLEYGSGGSSLFFGSLGAKVIAVENHAGWAKTVEERAQKLGLDVRVEYVATGLESPEELSASGFLTALDEWALADVVLVDSYDANDFDLRPIIARHAARLTRNGGLLVLDDYERYGRSVKALPGFERRKLSGPGPARRTVSSSAIFRRLG